MLQPSSASNFLIKKKKYFYRYLVPGFGLQLVQNAEGKEHDSPTLQKVPQ